MKRILYLSFILILFHSCIESNKKNVDNSVHVGGKSVLMALQTDKPDDTTIKKHEVTWDDSCVINDDNKNPNHSAKAKKEVEDQGGRKNTDLKKGKLKSGDQTCCLFYVAFDKDGNILEKVAKPCPPHCIVGEYEDPNKKR